MYHADLGIPGGFIGVDIFFVISGCVIGERLFSELDSTGTIRFREFYARRARRLLPALAATLLVTVAVMALVTNPAKLQPWGARTAASAGASLANVFLIRSGQGYFGARDGSNPFLHTWSLSVEEQFYMFLPFFVWLSARIARRVRRSQRGLTALLLGSITVLSLTASVVFTNWTGEFKAASQRFAFYGPVTRIWEFVIGVLIALFAGALARRVGSIALLLGIAGSALVLVGAFAYSSTTPFPGIVAGLPVSGTALLLIAGLGTNAVSKALDTGPLRWIGDRSYGWYLWHWPMIVFARTLWPGRHEAVVLAAALSLVPTVVSYRYLEQPIRLNRGIRGVRALRLAGVCIVIPALAAGSVAVGASRTSWGLDLSVITQRTAARDLGCHSEGAAVGSWPAERCTFRVDNSRGLVVLVGDSHGASVADVVTEAANDLDYDVAIWTRSGCPFNDVFVSEPTCRLWQQRAAQLVVDIHPAVVVVVNRTTAYLAGSSSSGADKVNVLVGSDGALVSTAADAERAWEDGLSSVFGNLQRDGVNVLLVSTVPEYSRAAEDDVSVVRPDGAPQSETLAEVARQRSSELSIDRALTQSLSSVASFDPVPALCTEICSQKVAGTWIYYDTHHLTVAGAERLRGPLRDALAGLLVRDP